MIRPEAELDGPSQATPATGSPRYRAASRIIPGKRQAVLVFAIVAASIAMPALAASNPKDDVRSMIKRALDVVRDKEMSLAAKRREFKDLAERHFDLAGMARDSLGAHWSDLTAAEQMKFRNAFDSIVSDTYLGQLRDYDRQEVQIVSQELAGGDAEVSGSMVGGNEEAVDLKFKLRVLEGKWRIKDYSFNSDNAMRNYRDDFRRAIENGGFDGLMDRLKALQADIDTDLKGHHAVTPSSSKSD
jgi:phospholipid transport system substrate-binding protein